MIIVKLRFGKDRLKPFCVKVTVVNLMTSGSKCFDHGPVKTCLEAILLRMCEKDKESHAVLLGLDFYMAPCGQSKKFGGAADIQVRKWVRSIARCACNEEMAQRSRGLNGDPSGRTVPASL
jgi:hypothetical protein